MPAESKLQGGREGNLPSYLGMSSNPRDGTTQVKARRHQTPSAAGEDYHHKIVSVEPTESPCAQERGNLRIHLSPLVIQP